MKTQQTPVVKGEMLIWHDGTEQRQLTVGTADWYAWLEHASRFSFENDEGTFSARKEPGRHGGAYWKAYRKLSGKLYRAYLGKSDAITLELLRAIAAKLARTQVNEPPRAHMLHQQMASLEHSLKQPASQAHIQSKVSSVTTLPLPLTMLIGREREVSDGIRYLRQKSVRLLTLTGPGGVGKTRLAIEIATQAQSDYPDGVRFIQLAPIQEAALVLPAIAQAFQLQGSGTLSLLDLLKAHLRHQRCLLVLDNFEQVVDAAALLVELLLACPALKMMVTSRETLRVRGERELVLMPLALPDPKTLSEYDTILSYGAIELFVERAQEVQPSFRLTSETASLIVEICQRLDGLPLALELAAARLKLLTLSDLLTRLTQRLTLLTGGPRDLPSRQRTLRATLQWSYDLLSPGEQRLFRLLASFAGGCTLSALETIHNMLGGESSVLEGVTSLLNKHLLYQREQELDEHRLLMLETLREYGLECLVVNHELDRVRDVQAAYYVRMAEEAAAAVGEEQERWFDRLEWERDNMRTVLQWLVEQGNHKSNLELALRLAGAVAESWTLRWHRWYVSEERNWVERALAQETSVAPVIKVRAFEAAAWLAFVLDDGRRAQEYYQKSLILHQEIGSQKGIAQAYHWLGFLAWTMHKDAVTAQSLLAKSCTIAENNSDTLIVAYFTMGNMAIDQGLANEAQEHLERCLALCISTGDKRNHARVLRGLGRVRFAQGDVSAAFALIEESLKLCRETKDQLHLAYALDLLGQLALIQGDVSKAQTYLEEGLTSFRALGTQRHVANTLMHVADVIDAQGDKDKARAMYRESLALFRQVGDHDSMAVCLQGWGRLVSHDNPHWVARLWGCAQTLEGQGKAHLFSLPIVYLPTAQADEQMLVRVRQRMGQNAFTAAWAEGQSVTPEQALTLPYEHVPSETRGNIGKQTTADSLTAREIEVLRLVAQGHTDAQIAEALVISPRTVHAHMRSIYRKLDINSRFTAIHYALEIHLV